jgi:hypothetical protein
VAFLSFLEDVIAVDAVVLTTLRRFSASEKSVIESVDPFRAVDARASRL